jgi:hypothetical protein
LVAESFAPVSDLFIVEESEYEIFSCENTSDMMNSHSVEMNHREGAEFKIFRDKHW